MNSDAASKAREAGSAARGDEPSSVFAEDIAILREESRDQLELLRSLVRLLLPKADDGGPKLEDLIAALVAQQRDIIVAIRQLQSDVQALLERSDGDRPRGGEAPHSGGNGSVVSPS
jgi:hypothetical protein